MGITVLKRARGSVVSGVTIHDEDARQRVISKDGLGDLTGTGLTKQKETDRFCGKEPDVAIFPIGSPSGFIGVFDQGLPIEFDQFGEHGSQEMSYPVKAFDQTPWIGLQLFTDASQRNSVQIMHNRRIGHQLVPIEAFRKHSGGTRLEDSTTLGAIAFGEPIDQRFSPKRATLHHEPLGVAFVHGRRAALRAKVPYRRNHGAGVFSLNEIGTWTSFSKVARTRPFRFASLFLWPIGFEGNL
jgi:hypothetical protein